VSKRKDSLYRSGRSKDWLKMKNPACEAEAGVLTAIWPCGQSATRADS
jgi:ATP-dependent DNA ligase